MRRNEARLAATIVDPDFRFFTPLIARTFRNHFAAAGSGPLPVPRIKGRSKIPVPQHSAHAFGGLRPQFSARSGNFSRLRSRSARPGRSGERQENRLPCGVAVPHPLAPAHASPPMRLLRTLGRPWYARRRLLKPPAAETSSLTGVGLRFQRRRPANAPATASAWYQPPSQALSAPTRLRFVPPQYSVCTPQIRFRRPQRMLLPGSNSDVSVPFSRRPQGCLATDRQRQ